MIDHEQYWTRVQTALDARRDPLEDEHVQAWLLEHPDDVDELARLRGRLVRVEETRTPVRRRRVGAFLAAAGVLAVAGGFALRAALSVAPPPETPPSSATATIPSTRVYELRLVVSTWRPGERTTTTVTDAGITHWREVDVDPWTRITTSTRGGTR